jgi:6,7-dimethyl-8-ribityllumazine synthase
MGTIRILEGELVARELKFAIVAARFNDFIVEPLVKGAVNTLKEQGADESNIDLVRVPGAYELPLIAMKLAQSKRYDAVIALGAVIKGATAHFEYVCNECASGLTHAALDSGVPVAFGVLTVDTIEQAVERAGPDSTNKGAEAALVAIQMASLLKLLDK